MYQTLNSTYFISVEHLLYVLEFCLV